MLSSDKKLVSLDPATLETLADKLVWLVQSDRQDTSATQVQKASVKPSNTYINTVIKRQ